MRSQLRRMLGPGTIVVLLSATLVVGEAGKAGAQAAAQPAPRTVEEVVRRHVDAVGGEKALQRHTSRHLVMVARMKLVDTLPEMESRSEQFAMAPDKVLMRMGMGPATLEMAVNGDIGWTRSEYTAVERLDSAKVVELRRLASPIPSYAGLRELAFLGAVSFEGRPAVAIRWMGDGGVVNTDYYDAVSGLRAGTDSEPQGGGAPTRMRYEDYRWVDGEQVAMTTTMLTNGRVLATVRVASVEYAPLDAKLFTPPAALAKSQ